MKIDRQRSIATSSINHMVRQLPWMGRGDRVIELSEHENYQPPKPLHPCLCPGW